MRFSINPHQNRVDQKWHSPLYNQQSSRFTLLNLFRHSRFSTEKNYGSIYVKNWCQCSGKPFTVAITLNEHAVGIRAKAKRAKVASIVQIYQLTIVWLTNFENRLTVFKPMQLIRLKQLNKPSHHLQTLHF